jgi:hypothetical protein
MKRRARALVAFLPLPLLPLLPLLQLLYLLLLAALRLRLQNRECLHHSSGHTHTQLYQPLHSVPTAASLACSPCGCAQLLLHVAVLLLLLLLLLLLAVTLHPFLLLV